MASMACTANANAATGFTPILHTAGPPLCHGCTPLYHRVMVDQPL